jgi:hypothetical protein
MAKWRESWDLGTVPEARLVSEYKRRLVMRRWSGPKAEKAEKAENPEKAEPQRRLTALEEYYARREAMRKV